MIGRTNSGGSLKLHVIGGTTKPSGAGENTIWVNTSVTIPQWCIQNTAPEEPANGDVYITVRLATDNKLDVGSAHSVLLYLGTARQYDSSEEKWNDLLGEVFYGGEWHSLNTYAYDGDLNSGVDNYNTEIGNQPWSGKASSGSSYEITNSDDHFTARMGGTAQAYVCTHDKIDLTGVSTVKFTYTRRWVSNSGNQASKLIVFLEKPSGSSAIPSASAQSDTMPITSSKKEATVDVSGLSGFYWVGIFNEGSTQSVNINVYKIELIS